MISLNIFLYNLFIQFYGLSISFASLFNNKARLWIDGRKNNIQNYFEVPVNQKSVWFHCASLGEFEQARPLIEKIKSELPHSIIILTFFSPSGFEIMKNYDIADLVAYLPIDTQKNARKFIDRIKPSLVFFTKYDLWYHYLFELKQKGIPVILFSAVFRKEQIFFKWYGKLFRDMLSMCTYIYVQNERSQKLLRKIDLKSKVAYDTRFDRVENIAGFSNKIELLNVFKTGHKVFIGGSTYNKDEDLIFRLIAEDILPDYKFIIAPHEVQLARIDEIEKKLKSPYILYSKASFDNISDKKVLIIDKIGVLSSLYAYSDIAYVGGGFGVQVHNILEPAVFGMPVIFGPNYFKANEAVELIEKKAAFSVSDYRELKNILSQFIKNDDAKLENAARVSAEYVLSRVGGTNQIFESIRKHLSK